MAVWEPGQEDGDGQWEAMQSHDNPLRPAAPLSFPASKDERTGGREINDLRWANFSTCAQTRERFLGPCHLSLESRGWLAGQWGRLANMFVFSNPNIEVSRIAEDTADS